MKPHNWWAFALIASLLIIGWSLVLPLRYDLEHPAPKHVEVRRRAVAVVFAVLWVWIPYWGPHVLNLIDWACK